MAATVRKILIVDDEPLARERLADLVRGVSLNTELREVGDGDAAVEAIKDWKPDVVFLDVQMPGRDGFAVVDAVDPKKMPPTVFVTAYDKHAIRAFDVSAVDYLLKPFDDDRFRAAWARLTAQHGVRMAVAESKKLTALLAHLGEDENSREHSIPRRYSDRVVVKKGERTIVVKLKDVQWIESDGNYITLHAGKDKHVLRETLTSFESRLDPERFMRIHRRQLVALDAMKEIQPWFGGDQVMILKDGQQLRISRNYRHRVAKQLAGLV